MFTEIKINNQTVKATKGDTILKVLQDNGIVVPTLCYMEGFIPQSSCRICVVEVEGKKELVPACSTPVTDWMSIHTHSEKVIQARKNNLELILAAHPDDCMYCIRNNNCTLQRLAAEFGVHERRFRKSGFVIQKDLSSPAVVKDYSKCIYCGRCVDICDQEAICHVFKFSDIGQGHSIRTFMDRPINLTACVQCGQCVYNCPTAALYEKNHLKKVEKVLASDVRKIALIDPAAILHIAALIPGATLKQAPEWVSGLLRKVGFDAVFLTAPYFEAIVNAEKKEIINGKGHNAFPLISSSCPASVRFLEYHFHELTDDISDIMLPEEIAARHIAMNFPGENDFTLFTTCTSKKAYWSSRNESEKALIHSVVNIEDLRQMSIFGGINLSRVTPSRPDSLIQDSFNTFQQTIFSGGQADAMFQLFLNDHKISLEKSSKPNDLRSTKNVKTLNFTFQKKMYTFMSVSGFSEMEQILEGIKDGRLNVDYLELSGCPGGCINGAGRPLSENLSTSRSSLRAVIDYDLPFDRFGKDYQLKELVENNPQQHNSKEIIR